MSEHNQDLKIAVTERDHTQGSSSAIVTLVEYGDYQCPYCAIAYPELKQLQKKFGKNLRFVFRNFPLSEAHEFAHPAAKIAEAAALLGQFWLMHDWLYENQNEWVNYGEPALEKGLRQLNLEESKLVKALQDPGIDAHIHSDFSGGVRSGVNGTPCFFLNGYRVDGGVDELEGSITAILNTK